MLCFFAFLLVPSSFFFLNLIRYVRRDSHLDPARTALLSTLPVLYGIIVQGARPVPLAGPELPALLFAGCSLLLDEPPEGERDELPPWIAALLSGVLILLSLLLHGGERLALAVYCAVSGAQVGISVCRMVLRRERLRQWIRTASVPAWAEDIRRLSVRCCLLAGAVFSLIVPSALWSLLILLSYLLLCLRNYLERPVLPSLRFETQLQELVCAVTRPKPSQDEDVDRDLYERCCQLMDHRKPFLVDKFSLTDLARALYTNKVYLSRSINYYSGKNFRQFVNYYRVKYAMEQFVANKHLRVSELSELSGFHSTVSFNMAFKLVTGVTPSDWKRQCLQSARRAERRP